MWLKDVEVVAYSESEALVLAEQMFTNDLDYMVEKEVVENEAE
jgi:hypothetical protein